MNGRVFFSACVNCDVRIVPSVCVCSNASQSVQTMTSRPHLTAPARGWSSPRSAGSHTTSTKGEGGSVFTVRSKLIKNMQGNADVCLWKPDPRKKTKIDEFRELINKKHGLHLGKLPANDSAMIVERKYNGIGACDHYTEHLA